MKKLCILPLVVVVLLCAGCGGIDPYPLAVGNAWIYAEYINGVHIGECTRRIKGINADKSFGIEVISQDSRGKISDSETNEVIKENFAGTYRGVVFIKMIPIEISLGQKWNNIIVEDDKSCVQSCRVASLEEVETPAGVFHNVYRIEYKIEEGEPCFIWFKEGVGIVKMAMKGEAGALVRLLTGAKIGERTVGVFSGSGPLLLPPPGKRAPSMKLEPVEDAEVKVKEPAPAPAVKKKAPPTAIPKDKSGEKKLQAPPLPPPPPKDGAGKTDKKKITKPEKTEKKKNRDAKDKDIF